MTTPVTSSPGPRADVAAARRIVAKVGSSSLASRTGGLDGDRVASLVDALADRVGRGSEVVLVSSGAIAAGLAPLRLARRPRDLATLQAAASVGQGLLVERYATAFARRGLRVGQVLLTADDVVRRAHYRNAHRTLTRLLELGVVPVVNENDTVATDEIRFGDNDRLAALVAHLVHADLLLLLSDVEGLYDDDPSRPGARLIDEVHNPRQIADVALRDRGASALGRGGIAAKADSARIATAGGVPVVLADAAQVVDALAGQPVGTYFHRRRGRRMATRLAWLAHASAPEGRLSLDAGAVAAVVDRRASLLPAGVTSVEGSFSAGDPVDLLDENGHVVARGLVNFDSQEIPDLLGRSTRELARERGPTYEREIVHRDDLVVLGH